MNQIQREINVGLGYKQYRGKHHHLKFIIIVTKIGQFKFETLAFSNVHDDTISLRALVKDAAVHQLPV